MSLPWPFPLLLALACGIFTQNLAVIPATLLAAESPSKVEFNRDIRPILSDKCFICHGPDSAKRKAGLRLDRYDSATANHDGSQAIVPRDSGRSEVFQRIRSKDPDLQMPPPDSNLKLSDAEIAILKRWIDDGAEYQPHWSFLPPKATRPPETRQSQPSLQPIDGFVHARLDYEGLTAAGPADKPTLIRRASFDLIGLPPSVEDVDEFANDPSPDAYERLIDRLLASPRFGERMAANWLDAARFADTNGYQTDGPRFMWRWRDWVIDAFNQNQPFDEFTIDQLAGDLLEDRDSNHSTIANARMIATGFNRNHRGNAEGGIIPEEFRIEYVVDRVETTSAVWLGLTIGCARCHDHKYDPISQREFYQLFDFFNHVPEPGKYIRNDNSMPYLPAPTVDQQRQLTALETARDAAETAWEKLRPDVRQGMTSVAATIQSQTNPVDWTYSESLDCLMPLDGDNRLTVMSRPKNGSAAMSEPISLVCGWKNGDATSAEGRIGQAAAFDGRRFIEAASAGDFGEDESFAISCWVNPMGNGPITILARMDHDNSSRGYELRREASGRLQALFSGRILDDLIRVETQSVIPENEWSHLFVSYDGSSAARGVVVRVNGVVAELKVITDLLSNPIRVKNPLCVGAGGSASPFMGRIDELRTYRGRLTNEAALSLAAGDSIASIAGRLQSGTASAPEMEKFREFYLSVHAPPAQRQARQNLLDATRQYAAYLATVPTTMVMQDRVNRETHLLKRGEYDKPLDRVQAAFPAVLATPGSAPSSIDRLALARWLVSGDNPLTARVTVNRYWQSLFGVGIVKTAEDFGTQGEAPSHPELLDWLAIEFGHVLDPAAPGARSRWDVKRMLRLMTTSATYRRSSQASGMAIAKDPDNRWLARGPRFRLPAEMIRDAALAASGLLVERIGGPSVKPYQPPGLWEELSADAVPGPFSIYVQDHGANLYRRGIYTFRKRTSPPPSLAIFDASPREACRVSLPRTNTPLQALTLMNDVTYLEAARVLAEKGMKEGGASPPSRLIWVFRRILSREPTDLELKVLVDGFDRRRQTYQQHADEVNSFLKLGESPVDPTLLAHELAAYAATASVIFNLDEFVAKP